MSRCDYDNVFYRVFCVTLLGVAFVFTVILTNVFIDIDGLLSRKGEKRNSKQEELTTHANIDAALFVTENHLELDKEDLKSEDFYKESDEIIDKEDDAYRIKRSLGSENFLYHIKNKKIKSVLTNRLAKLLEELDEDESDTRDKRLHNTPDKTSNKFSNDYNIRIGEKYKIENEKNNDRVEKIKEGKNDIEEKQNKNELIHQAMHSILLHGIIEHMDLNDVYKKIHDLIKNLKNKKDGNTERIKYKVKLTAEKTHERNNSKPLEETEDENEFFEEMIKCKRLQNDIAMNSEINKSDDIRKHSSNKEPNILIKTFIDIESIKGKNEHNTTNSNDGIKGIIKLIYNGKTVKVNQIDDADINKTEDENERKLSDSNEMYNSQDGINSNSPKMLINKMLSSYLKKYPIDNDNSYSFNTETKNVELKRLKRHVRVRFEKEKTTTEKPERKTKKKDGKDDDELYVEIETHFDDKGLKGERKKKLIRDLINKIQKAIRSDADSTQKQKMLKHVHIKKRLQNPLTMNESELIKKIAMPIERMVTREVDPLNKAKQITEELPSVLNKSKEQWKKQYLGPKFFSVSKSINSGEMSEVDLDYNKILKSSGIPQRLQKPLNTDMNGETRTNTYLDFGNMKFFVKELDGSGFSIGFNQFVDNVPDNDNILTNIDDIIKTYQQVDDKDVLENIPIIITPMEAENPHELKKRDVAQHKIVMKRSIKEDIHSNEYKIFFDGNFLPYDNYQEIYEDGNKKVTVSLKKEEKSVKQDYINDIKSIPNNIRSKEFPVSINDDIFTKNLKPSEKVSLATIIDRRKRSLNLQKISNMKIKKRLNKFINTNAKPNKKLYLKNKRNKRQIGKIRIVARDNPESQKTSDENIFVISDEKLFADRATVKEVEAPEFHAMPEEKPIEGNYEYVPPLPPYTIEEHKFPQPIVADIYENMRHNSLMSKYPHIFLDEMPKSKDEDIPANPIIYSKIIQEHKTFDINPAIQKTQIIMPTTTAPIPMVDDMFKLLLPDTKSNYKLTVKLLPKNTTESNPGFKEVHTSINKSFHNHGMLYSSLVNVSEISKIEAINKTKYTTPIPILKQIKEQQERIKLLLKQHRERIDQQLNRLSDEKKNLLAATANTQEKENFNNKEIIDVALPFNPPQMIQLSKDDISKLVSTALFKLQEGVTQTQPTTTAETTTISVPITTTEADINKLIILKTIEKNENLTSMILDKINMNTEILQSFLRRFQETASNRLEPSESIVEKHANEDFNLAAKTKNLQNMIHEPFFSRTMPNFEVYKNDTHVSIPFVYAYQQPYNIPNDKPQNVASVVYHGHIHTNALNKNPKDYAKSPNDFKFDKVKNNNRKRDTNVSRFFIDDLENDYKVLPLETAKKSIVLPTTATTKVNSTI